MAYICTFFTHTEVFEEFNLIEKECESHTSSNIMLALSAESLENKE